MPHATCPLPPSAHFHFPCPILDAWRLTLRAAFAVQRFRFWHAAHVCAKNLNFFWVGLKFISFSCPFSFLFGVQQHEAAKQEALHAHISTQTNPILYTPSSYHSFSHATCCLPLSAIIHNWLAAPVWHIYGTTTFSARSIGYLVPNCLKSSSSVSAFILTNFKVSFKTTQEKNHSI